jgi:type II secretory pathway component PulK
MSASTCAEFLARRRFATSIYRLATHRGFENGRRVSRCPARLASLRGSIQRCSRWGRRVSKVRRRRERGGFVMLTTLWVMSIASVVAMAAALVGRHAVFEGSARVELERGRWIALGCERRAQAAIDALLRDARTFEEGSLVWRTLSRRIVASPFVQGCDLSLEAAGTRLDVNAASREMIANLLAAIGQSDRAAEMADALDDWRDADDEALPLGAERDWYESAGRELPRNGPLADVGELRRVRGFENVEGLDSVLAIEPGRVSLATAPLPVLMAIPGITRETAEQIVAMRDAGTPLNDLLSVAAMVSPSAASTLAERFPDAVRATTPDPDAWLVRIRVSRGMPAVSVRLEWRVIRTGGQCLVAQTRSIL